MLFIQDLASYERVREDIRAAGSITHRVFFDHAGVDIENAISYRELLARGQALRDAKPQLLDDLTLAVSPEDIATLIYTSGTTGEPKGVMLSHTNIISNVIDSGANFQFSGRDVPLSVLPLSHIFERSAMYVYILNGMAVHYAESIDKAADNLREVRPTLFVGVPRIFEKVYARAKLKAAQAGPVSERIFDWAIDTAKEMAADTCAGRKPSIALWAKHAIADRLVFAKFREFFGGRLRFCITGGAALSNDIFLIFTGAGISIMQGYGLTETSPVISSNNPEATRIGTVGRPIRNFEVRIASDGEIEARGPGVMLGYYKKDVETAEAFTGDGWFRTGDIGQIDSDGYLTITDRKKELFKTSGGKYVAPSPIEQKIKASRFVSQVVLVGNERKFPAALIVPNFEQLRSYAKHKGFAALEDADTCDDPKIVDLIRRQIDSLTKDLSQFEKVKGISLIKDELTVEGGELTPTLKVKRRVVEEKYKDAIDRMYREAESSYRQEKAALSENAAQL